MAARRTHLGLRRRGPGLNALALAVLLLVLPGCFGLSEEEESRLDFFRESALGAYDRGDYMQSMHQASMALELDETDAIMLLVKGFCQLKLGKASNNALTVDDALDTFALAEDDLEDDFRVYLGMGSAHLARALLTEHEIARSETRLESEFLSPESRDAEGLRLEQERERAVEHLQQAESNLRRVLDFDLQKDNLYALMDLVLVLNAQGGGRDLEALELADRALVLNDESTRFTEAALENNKRLSAGAKIDLSQRLDSNRDRERMLRDLMATVYFNRGDYDGFLAQMQALEDRGLLQEAQLHNRAAVREALGQYDGAADDLQALLRMRVRRLDYEQDELAPEIFRRLEELKARHAEPAAP